MPRDTIARHLVISHPSLPLNEESLMRDKIEGNIETRRNFYAQTSIFTNEAA